MYGIEVLEVVLENGKGFEDKNLGSSPGLLGQ